MRSWCTTTSGGGCGRRAMRAACSRCTGASQVTAGRCRRVAVPASGSTCVLQLVVALGCVPLQCVVLGVAALRSQHNTWRRLCLCCLPDHGSPLCMHVCAEDSRLVFGTDPNKLDGCNPTATPFPAGEQGQTTALGSSLEAAHSHDLPSLGCRPAGQEGVLVAWPGLA